MDKIREKIAKLLNMTTGNGCSEDEQETAMSMAASLAARNGIELDSVRAASGEKAPRRATRKAFMKEWKPHQILAFQAAGILYGCKLYVYDWGKGGCFFVGREENIELAEATAMWLMRQVELLYKQHLPRGLSVATRAQYRRTFKAACASRVYDRAEDLMRKMEREGIKSEGVGGNALVVQGYFETLRAENNAFWDPTPEQKAQAEKWAAERAAREEARRAAMTPEQRAREDKEKEREEREALRRAMKRKGPRPRTLPTGIGTEAGRAAGESVQLRREVR